MSTDNKKNVRHFVYDPLDRFIGADATLLFYNQTRLATEIEGGRTRRLFEYDAQPLALQQDGTICTLLATDMQTSVLHSVSADGTQQAHAYTPFGHQSDSKEVTSVSGFNGERPDPVTEHYLLGQGYRAFNPMLMRFNIPDSLSPFGKGGINAYGYCGGDPLNRVDPTGHFFSKIYNYLARAVIKSQALLTGGHVKKVHKITRLSKGIITFEDTYKGQQRLNFVAHGRKSGNKAQMMIEPKKGINAQELFYLASNNQIELKKFKHLRTIMCYSGDGGLSSFGSDLSSITGRPVKAYKGTVTTSDPELIIPALNNGETSSMNSLLLIEKNHGPRKLLSSKWKDNYEPITFSAELRAKA